MHCRFFAQFVMDIGRFLKREFTKTHVMFIVRKNLLQYSVWFVKV